MEEVKDYRKVEEITREAFSYPGRIERGGIGCPYEHWMVHSLRKQDGVMELSYIAEVDGMIVGHIIYSKATVETTDGQLIEVLNFGPLSVKPEYQKQGVGKALMNATIAKATELGYGAILFFGHPEYYPQFGFVEAERFGISDSKGYNFPAFMAMELQEGYLNGVQGNYFESTIYNESMNRDAVKRYDESFESY